MWRTWGAGSLLALVAACATVPGLYPETSVSVSRGAALFAENCAACHGADARGGGPASLGLGVVPPSLVHLQRDNGGVFPRDDTISVIDGYFRQDHFDNPMPVFGDGDLGPLIQVEENGISTPIPAKLLALSNYLESIQVE